MAPKPQTEIRGTPSVMKSRFLDTTTSTSTSHPPFSSDIRYSPTTQLRTSHVPLKKFRIFPSAVQVDCRHSSMDNPAMVNSRVHWLERPSASVDRVTISISHDAGVERRIRDLIICICKTLRCQLLNTLKQTPLFFAADYCFIGIRVVATANTT